MSIEKKFTPEQIETAKWNLAQSVGRLLDNWKSGVGATKPKDYPYLIFPKPIQGKKDTLYQVRYFDAATFMKDHLEQGRCLILLTNELQYPIIRAQYGLNEKSQIYFVPSLVLPLHVLTENNQIAATTLIDNHFPNFVTFTYNFYSQSNAGHRAYLDGSSKPLSWIKIE